jgi:hypothetical protein
MVYLDEKFGLFTVCMPLIGICYGTVYIGCYAMDRQKELRWLRVQSISFKEFQKKEEEEMLDRMMAKYNEDNYELVEIPKIEQEAVED